MADALASQLNNTSLGYVDFHAVMLYARREAYQSSRSIGMRMQNGRKIWMLPRRMLDPRLRFVESGIFISHLEGVNIASGCDGYEGSRI